MTETLIHAPDLPYDAEWRNVDRALSFYDDLQGHVVLVHFFCPSSRYCHNSLAALQLLQRRFGDRGFVVVHVASPRFCHEREPAALDPLLQALAIEQPVVLDPEGEMFAEWQAQSWPQLVLVDAGGRLRFSGGGEPDLPRLQDAVQVLLDEAAAEGDEPYQGLDTEFQQSPRERDQLCAPGGLCLDAQRRLWIADTGNHRLLCVDPASGALCAVVGAGEAGCQDGVGAAARFFLPRALSTEGSDLFVVDAGNHLLRRVDLLTLEVQTLCGTGRAMVDPSPNAQGPAQALHSPAGVAAEAGRVFVAAAAQHQILQLQRADQQVSLLCGSSRRGLSDGPARDCELAQPAALCLAPGELGILDTESSALRVLDLESGVLRSLVGRGLQEWGDADGEAGLFQDPRGLCRLGADWLVADTGNDKLRRVSDTGRVRTLGVAGLCRPEALAVLDQRLFVADTGNHRIVAVELESGDSETLALPALPQAGTAFGTSRQDCAALELGAQQSAELRLPLGLGADEELDLSAELSCSLHNLEGNCLLVDSAVRPDQEGDQLVLRGLGFAEAQSGVLGLELRLVSRAGPGLVGHPLERRLRLPLRLVEDGPSTGEVRPLAGAL